jgi:hypothetical protein
MNRRAGGDQLRFVQRERVLAENSNFFNIGTLIANPAANSALLRPCGATCP